MSLQDGTSSKESFNPKGHNPKEGSKTQRPTENGEIGNKGNQGTKK